MVAVKSLSGRHIYVTDLKKVLGSDKPAAFASRCRDAHFNGVWIRMGRGQPADPNMSLPSLDVVRQQLKAVGVELWGWHVPFCQDEDAAFKEATAVLNLADTANLDGVVVDAERTDDSPRFQGGAREAEVYLAALEKGLAKKNRGFAFSSHDQPSLHQDLPFKVFLKHITDICPQVYYRAADPAPRLAKSVKDYRKLLPAADFKTRYKPTGNITMGEDVGFPDIPSCEAATCRA
jgi:hypothetical protein